MHRRRFSQWSAGRAVSVLSLFLSVLWVRAHVQTGGGHQTGQVVPPAVTNLAPFIDPLPIPRTARPARIRSSFALPWNPNIVVTNVAEYDMPMTQFKHRFHSHLPEVDVWGYDGSYPGPTIRATTNVPVLVNWINRLPASYTNTTWLVANTNFHGVENQDVRTVVHLHGAATLPRYDGYPTDDFKSGFSDTYLYNNYDLNGDGETLWYHDHAIGVTANNVYAGLEGFYLLTSPGFEENHDLPKDDYEIPLVLQDRDIQMDENGTNLLYQSDAWPYHYLGVVNGVVTPYLEVEPRPYRFRVLNGANQRTFGLALQFTNQVQTNTLPFYVIGTEDGFLQKTATVNGVNLMSGERIDLIMDFSAYGGSNLTLINTVLGPGSNALEPSAPAIPNLMQFRVTRTWTGSNAIPGVLVPANEWTTTTNLVDRATVTREITLDLTSEVPFPGSPFQTNAPFPFALLNLAFFEDAITEKPRAGQTEIWSFINLSPDAHPIHVHLLDFRVLDRTRFRGVFSNPVNFTNPPAGVSDYINDRFNKRLQPLRSYLSGNPGGAQPFEAGPKDVVRAAPYAVTRIVMTWPTNEIFYTSPSAANLDPATAGRYVYHCHLLEHEDNDMMRPLQVIGPAASSPFELGLIYDSSVNPSPIGDNHFLLSLQGAIPSETYRFETTTNLTAGIWTPFLVDVLGAMEGIVIRPPASTNGLQVYRVRPFTVLRPPMSESTVHP